MLRFDQLHRFATGKGQAVAVIDTGVNRHDFLGDRLTGGGDYVVAGDNGLRDCDGHGTEVAGIIAANPPADSGIAFQGIAPDAPIVSIRQTSGNYLAVDPNDPDTQGRNAGTLLTLAQAIVHAANRVPHGVINISVNRCRASADVRSPPRSGRCRPRCGSPWTSGTRWWLPLPEVVAQHRTTGRTQPSRPSLCSRRGLPRTCCRSPRSTGPATRRRSPCRDHGQPRRAGHQDHLTEPGKLQDTHQRPDR
jgi:hypothetical protein